MTKEELCFINGGVAVSSTLLNALIRMTTTSLELGRTLGSLIRRALEKKKCK